MGTSGGFLAGLHRDLLACWPEPGTMRSASGDRWLLGLGLGLLLVAMLFWLSAGAFAAFHAVNAAAAWAPEGFWGLTTSAGDGLVLGVIGLFLARRHPHVLWILFIGIVLAGVFTHVPKNFLDLPRPAGVLEAGSFYLIGPELRSKGPPSGHSIAIFALIGIGLYFLRSTGSRILLLALAALIAISRVVVGAHWPLDVLMGSGLGLLTAWIAIWLADRFPWGRNPWVHVGLLGFFIAAALALLNFDPGYPLGRELSVFIASSALFVVSRHYLFDPVSPESTRK
jgi:membrane-associated phospholipid phosphatase